MQTVRRLSVVALAIAVLSGCSPKTPAEPENWGTVVERGDVTDYKYQAPGGFTGAKCSFFLSPANPAPASPGASVPPKKEPRWSEEYSGDDRNKDCASGQPVRYELHENGGLIVTFTAELKLNNTERPPQGGCLATYEIVNGTKGVHKAHFPDADCGQLEEAGSLQKTFTSPLIGRFPPK